MTGTTAALAQGAAPQGISAPGGARGSGGATSGRPTAAVRGTVERLAVGSMAVAFAAQFAVRPSGPGNSSPVDVLTLVSLLSVAMWAASARLPVRAPYAVGFGLMVVGGALAGLVSDLPGTALLALAQDVVLLAWGTAVVTVARDPARLRLLATTWAYAATACAAVLVAGSLAHLTVITGVVAREGNRALFTFGDPNYAATYWVLSLFVVYAAKVPRRSGPRVLAYAVLVWALLLTESNGGLVELGLGCLLIAAVAMYRRHGLVGAIACVLLTGVVTTTALTVVPLSSIQTWARTSGQSILVNSLGRSNDSSAQRSLLVTESLQLYMTGSALGTGPATTKALLSARGYPYAKEAHDDYLAALVERGPVGLLGLVVLLASAAYRAGRLLRPRAGPPQPRELPRPVGLVAALLATAAASTYYEVMHFRFVWGLLAFVAAASFADAASRGPQRGAARAAVGDPP